MKIELTYIRNGEPQKLRLQSAESNIRVDMSAITNFAGGISGYGYADIDGTEVLRKSTWTGGSYLTTSQYSNNATAETIRKTAALRAQLSALPWDGANVLKLSTNPDMQFVDTTVPENDRDESSGESMTFGTSGTLKFCIFSKTEYPGGVPTTISYNGGISLVKPVNHDGVLEYAGNVRGEYNSENAPVIALWDMIIHDDVFESHLGKDILCLLIMVRAGTTVKSTIVSQNLFDNAIIPAQTQDTPRRTVTPYGRTGTYNFSSDKMVPVAPTGYTFANRWAHGITIYHIDDNQCEAIQNEFWGNDTLFQKFLNATVHPIQGVITLHKMPIYVPSGAKQKPLTIFGRRIKNGMLLDALNLVNDMFVTVSGNWFPIDEIYGDFYDYAGQSRLSVNLPFIGCIPLDINKIMGGTVRTIYYFDVLTGNCTAQIYGRNGMGNGAEVLLYQGCGNCALHIPYCGNDQGGMKQLGALAGIATAGIATLATGGSAAAPAMALLRGATDTVMSQHQATVNNIPTECAPLSYPYVCYIMEYPERVMTDIQLRMRGYSAASGLAGTKVANYTGYVQGYLHADISGATENEKAEIEQAFRNGVIV